MFFFTRQNKVSKIKQEKNALPITFTLPCTEKLLNFSNAEKGVYGETFPLLKPELRVDRKIFISNSADFYLERIHVLSNKYKQVIANRGEYIIVKNIMLKNSFDKEKT